MRDVSPSAITEHPLDRNRLLIDGLVPLVASREDASLLEVIHEDPNPNEHILQIEASVRVADLAIDPSSLIGRPGDSSREMKFFFTPDATVIDDRSFDGRHDFLSWSSSELRTEIRNAESFLSDVNRIREVAGQQNPEARRDNAVDAFVYDEAARTLGYSIALVRIERIDEHAPLARPGLDRDVDAPVDVLTSVPYWLNRRAHEIAAIPDITDHEVALALNSETVPQPVRERAAIVVVEANRFKNELAVHLRQHRDVLTGAAAYYTGAKDHPDRTDHETKLLDAIDELDDTLDGYLAERERSERLLTFASNLVEEPQQRERLERLCKHLEIREAADRAATQGRVIPAIALEL